MHGLQFFMSILDESGDNQLMLCSLSSSSFLSG